MKHWSIAALPDGYTVRVARPPAVSFNPLSADTTLSCRLVTDHLYVHVVRLDNGGWLRIAIDEKTRTLYVTSRGVDERIAIAEALRCFYEDKGIVWEVPRT